MFQSPVVSDISMKRKLKITKEVDLSQPKNLTKGVNIYKWKLKIGNSNTQGTHAIKNVTKQTE